MIVVGGEGSFWPSEKTVVGLTISHERKKTKKINQFNERYSIA